MKEKKIYLEAIRICAIFFVIYVHTGFEAVEHYQVAENTFSYALSLVLYAIAQICVPLFFMVSGGVLLHKVESLKDVLVHRALKILLIILIFGFIQYAYYYYLNPEVGFSIPVFFWTIYSTTIITQYWYLYSYFALMLMLPFVRMMAQSMKDYHFWYLMGLMFILDGLLPIAEFLWGNNRIAVSVPLLINSIFYPLIGYYIVQRSGELFYKTQVLLLANIVALCALITNSVVALIAHRQRGGAETLGGMTEVLAIVTFINIRALFQKVSKSSCKFFHSHFSGLLKKSIIFIGGGVFGVYLLEPQLRDFFKIIYIKLEPHISWFPASVIWIVTAILCGSIIFQLLKRIPFLNKIL